jgi:hypothetical protein
VCGKEKRGLVVSLFYCGLVEWNGSGVELMLSDEKGDLTLGNLMLYLYFALR